MCISTLLTKNNIKIKKIIITEIGKSLNGKITDCKFCDKKHGFKVCSNKCPKSMKEEFCDNCNNDVCVCTIQKIKL